MQPMVPGSGDLVTDAWLRTPFQAPDVAPFVRASQTILRIIADGAPADVPIHRYVCRMENALYAPGSVGLLNAKRDTVITAHPLRVNVPETAMGFGRREAILPDNRMRIHYPAPSHVVDGPAICMHFSGGAAVFLRDVMLGVYRARRMLGMDVPVLVPDDLDDRRLAFLKLAGVSEDNLIAVPAKAVTTVRLALIPTRSFARDVRIKLGLTLHSLRFLMEPEDTLAFNAMIQNCFGGGAGRRLYVSREDASTRRVLNEAAVMDVLGARGFEKLLLADMPVADLVSAFANAEMVLSPHGSGLTNILFAPRHARVIEIDHPRSDYVAHGLSRALGQPFRIFQKIPDEARERGSSVSQTVGIDALVELIDAEIASLNQA